jgi:hypothetical protein
VRDKVVLYCLVKKKREERLSCSQLLSGAKNCRDVSGMASHHRLGATERRLSYMGILANQCSLEPQVKIPKPLKTRRSLGSRK